MNGKHPDEGGLDKDVLIQMNQPRNDVSKRLHRAYCVLGVGLSTSHAFI